MTTASAGVASALPDYETAVNAPAYYDTAEHRLKLYAYRDSWASYQGRSGDLVVRASDKRTELYKVGRGAIYRSDNTLVATLVTADLPSVWKIEGGDELDEDNFVTVGTDAAVFEPHYSVALSKTGQRFRWKRDEVCTDAKSQLVLADYKRPGFLATNLGVIGTSRLGRLTLHGSALDMVEEMVIAWTVVRDVEDHRRNVFGQGPP